MTIKFELPSNDELVLKHFGTALTNIAAELRGEKPQVVNVECHAHVGHVEPDTTDQQYASLAEDGANVEAPVEPVETAADDTPPPPPVQDVPKQQPVTDVVDEGESQDDRAEGVELDTNGLPWDGRIHSANKTRNADDSWRNSRKPKKFETDEEWKQYISTVEAELKGAISGETVADDTPPPPPVVETEPTPFDQAVTVDVDDVPPPPSDVPERTFPELMKLVTSNAAKGSVAKVQQILTEMNLGSLQTLNTARPDMVSTVYAKLSDQLGD